MPLSPGIRLGPRAIITTAIIVVASPCIPCLTAGGHQNAASQVPAPRGIAREIVTDFVGRGPAISRDGRYLAYAGLDNTIHVRELVTGVDRRLTALPRDASRPNGRLTFSPDGKMIAWGWQDEPGGHPQLRVVSIDGAVLTIPYRSDEWPGVGPWGNWSADGKQILTLAIRFPRDIPHTRRIALISAADGSIRSVKTLQWEANPNGLSLSPDGRHIVYDYPVEEGSADRDIFMLSTNGEENVRLVAGTPDDRQPFFTPDGRGVLFLRRRPGNADSVSAWVVPVANGSAAGIPELLNPDLGPDVTAVGFTQDGSFYYRRGTAILVMEGARR